MKGRKSDEMKHVRLVRTLTKICQKDPTGIQALTKGWQVRAGEYGWASTSWETCMLDVRNLGPTIALHIKHQKGGIAAETKAFRGEKASVL